jgi:acetylglutamate kinase
MVHEAIRKADVLIEALPYIKKFHKKIFVIKYGGSILGEERVRRSVLEDIAFLRYAGIRPIIVHGGGPNITERMKDEKIDSNFIAGIRVTDKGTLKIVEEELNKLNDVIVKEIESHGVKATGFKNSDKLLTAAKKENEVDLGYVGEITDVDEAALDKVLATSIPVICPMGVSEDKKAYNINADEAAFFLASKLKAEKLVLLTNVLGVMGDPRDDDSLISTITVAGIEELIEKNTIDEGMIPKVRAAAGAINAGVGKAHIVDAKIPHALLLEIFTDQGVSTEIVK